MESMSAPLHIHILGIGAVTRHFVRNWPEPAPARRGPSPPADI